MTNEFTNHYDQKELGFEQLDETVTLIFLKSTHEDHKTTINKTIFFNYHANTRIFFYVEEPPIILNKEI